MSSGARGCERAGYEVDDAQPRLDLRRLRHCRRAVARLKMSTWQPRAASCRASSQHVDVEAAGLGAAGTGQGRRVGADHGDCDLRVLGFRVQVHADRVRRNL